MTTCNPEEIIKDAWDHDPHDIGAALLSFAYDDLSRLVSYYMCASCPEDADCEDCPGLDIHADIENQLGAAAVEFCNRELEKWMNQ